MLFYGSTVVLFILTVGCILVMLHKVKRVLNIFMCINRDCDQINK